MNTPSTITIIPLQTAKLDAPHLSQELIHTIESTIESGKKCLIFYSRRGNARAWICGDCGHYEKCPHCDIAFAYHTTPRKCLICHHCGQIAPFPIVCPNCQGSKINPV